ncbi:hypothetical protein MKW98_028231, partial [Papaver atlanticum]
TSHPLRVESWLFSVPFHSFKSFSGIFCLLGSSLDQGKNTSTGYTPPAIFIFGDSLADVGNNNHLNTIAKAVSYPSGIDFPGGKPTGRYTNGRTVIDIVGQELGLKKFIPPSNDPATVGEVVFHGVNYASGGAGILNKTGYLFGARINLYAQIDNFAKTRQYIIRCLGSTGASELFKNAIFNFAVGCNDYLDNYFTPIFSIPDQIFVNVDVFTDLLISEFRIQLTSLYNLDARKIVVENIPVIGCIPTVREFSELWAPDTCSKQINNAAMLFNRKLKALIRELNSKLVGAKFVYADIYHIFSDLLHNYKAYGFGDNSSACCAKFGRFGGLSFCVPDARLCPDRSKYIFWDNAHPTDAANAVVAKRMVDGNINDMYPINIRKLVGQKKL